MRALRLMVVGLILSSAAPAGGAIGSVVISEAEDEGLPAFKITTISAPISTLSLVRA